jgi:N-acetylmuramate 1-kinase
VAEFSSLIHLEDEQATLRLAEDIALALAVGDCLTLSGDLGAGKSTLARAVIRAIAVDDRLEVPSPTFTLVQTYDLRLPVSHFDLYRLGSPDELDELGLDEALETGAALIEWPQRAGERIPADAVALGLTGSGAGRDLEITGAGPFVERFIRARLGRAFLAAHGHGDTRRTFLQGDASSRSYERIGDGGLILMNAPRKPDGPPVRHGLPYSRIARLAEDVTPFVAIDLKLRDWGFAAPDIPAADLENGFLLVENLGSQTIRGEDGEPDSERYLAAIDCLAALHEKGVPDPIALPGGNTYEVPPYDREALGIEVELLTDWYLPYKTGAAVSDAVKADYLARWQEVFDGLDAAPKALVLRDYHSPNLIWRPEREGNNRIGLIDFQDALIGPAAYDVASLVQDARVTVPDPLADMLLARYEERRLSVDPAFDPDAFRAFYAIMAAQRAAKILGIFVRLDRRDGKPAYLAHLPRIEAYMARSLAHPALGPLRSWFAGAGIATADS